MKKKFNILSICSFIISLVVFVISYIFYHYVTSDFKLSPNYMTAPAKPLVTYLFSILGVMFLFCSIITPVIGAIFFNEK